MKNLVFLSLTLALLGCGPSVEEQKKMIHAAAKAGDAAQVIALVGKNPSLASNLETEDHARSPLHQAANREVAQALLDAGADPRALDRLGFTPLHTARDAGVAELLLSKGVDVNVQESGRKLTPVHTASSAEVLRFLVAHGGKLWVEKYQTSPLSYAVENSSAAVVEAMIDLGADTKQELPGRKTFLHVAAQLGRADIVETLVKKGMFVDAPDAVNATPLHYAALTDHVDVAKVLLDNGANVHAQLSRGAAIADQNQRVGGVHYDQDAGAATPIKIAVSEPMKALLRQYGARSPT